MPATDQPRRSPLRVPVVRLALLLLTAAFIIAVQWADPKGWLFVVLEVPAWILAIVQVRAWHRRGELRKTFLPSKDPDDYR